MTTSTRHDAPIWPARARAWATLLLAAMAWPLGGCAGSYCLQQCGAESGNGRGQHPGASRV